MQKIALITDSACDLDLNTLKENNINLLPLRIIYSNAEYRDRIDISPSEVYKNLENEIPKTSLPSAKDTEEILNKLEEESYTHVICISISSGLSGSYNALRLALEDHPNLTSFVYDTKILAYPQGEIVLEVAKLIREGKNFNEIVSEIPNIRKRITGYFTLNTLEYLKKGGRIGRLAGTVGELLNLKPIITTDENGVYYTVTKVRGRKQSLSKMTELLKGYLEKCKCEVAVLHAGCEEEAIKYMEAIKNLPNISSIKIAEISPEEKRLYEEYKAKLAEIKKVQKEKEAVGQVFTKGLLPIYVLHILKSGPTNGNEISTKISERTNGLWTPSTGGIYPLLKKLEKEGLVIGQWDDPKKKFQKFYSLTPLGEKEFDNRKSLLKHKIEESLMVFQIVYKDLYL